MGKFFKTKFSFLCPRQYYESLVFTDSHECESFVSQTFSVTSTPSTFISCFPFYLYSISLPHYRYFSISRLSLFPSPLSLLTISLIELVLPHVYRSLVVTNRSQNLYSCRGLWSFSLLTTPASKQKYLNSLLPVL